MAYDERLAARIRELLDERPDVTERKMFGGLAFLVGGTMAVAASARGGALVRVDPAESDALVARTGAELAVMGGRPIDGWVRVGATDLATRRQLARWVDLGVGRALALPAKAARRRAVAPRRVPS